MIRTTWGVVAALLTQRRISVGRALAALLAACSIGIAPAPPAWSQSPPDALGIALENWPYPFPVAFYDFMLESQPVRQAYMDVAPTGPANGRTALLFHGRNFPASYWDGVIRGLARAGYRVIATDQIGFGKSSKPDLAYTFDMMARNSAGLLDQLGVRQVDLIGHSLGGMLAARFTRTYPERVRKLVLTAPLGLEDYRFTVPPVTNEQLIAQELRQTAEGYRNFLKNSYSLSLPDSAIEPFVEIHERLKQSGEYPRWVKSFIRSYQMIHDQPVVHEYHLIKTPTLFVMGANDHNAPGKPYASPDLAATMGRNADNAKAIAAKMPNASVVVFEGVGHIPHLERPQPFLQTVLGFLDAP